MNDDIKLSHPYAVFSHPEEDFPTHAHNEYELLFFLKGNVTYCVESKKYDLKKYDLVIGRPIEYHSVLINSTDEYERVNILIPLQSRLVKFLTDLPQNIHVIDCTQLPIVIDCFNRFVNYYNTYDVSPELEELTVALLTEVFYCIKSKLNHEFVQTPQLLSPVIDRAIAYINDNLFTIKNIDEVADRLYVSKNYFFKIFKEQLKISPKKYIASKRLLHAQMLIAKGALPTAIYTTCGFDNYVSFYKGYKEYFGYPPSEEPTF